MKINYNCRICGKECLNCKSLSSHLRYKHNTNLKDYYDSYFKEENENKCLVCGKLTSFISFNKGYTKYCSIQCNHSTEEFKNKIREGMKNSEHWQQVLKSEEYRKSLSEGHKNGNYVQNVMKTKKYKDNMRKSVLNSEKWIKSQQDPERKNKLSIIASKRAENGEMFVKYKFENKTFSSSYELAYYIWLKDNNINFIYQADSIPFDFYGVTKHYVPDFKINDRLVEIKGIHFFENKDPNGKMICPWKHKNDTPEKIKLRNELFEAKHQCMIRNNVEIITDCSKYIEYVETKYGKSFFKEHKIKK